MAKLATRQAREAEFEELADKQCIVTGSGGHCQRDADQAVQVMYENFAPAMRDNFSVERPAQPVLYLDATGGSLGCAACGSPRPRTSRAHIVLAQRNKDCTPPMCTQARHNARRGRQRRLRRHNQAIALYACAARAVRGLGQGAAATRASFACAAFMEHAHRGRRAQRARRDHSNPSNHLGRHAGHQGALRPDVGLSPSVVPLPQGRGAAACVLQGERRVVRGDA
eukprot:1728037-Pleurochrysis_carterae.AAC.2